MAALLDREVTFQEVDFGLDRRLLKALAKLGFAYPTLVQSRCIPIALQGKDMLVRARTGSGKTAAYALPMLQKILAEKAAEAEAEVRAVVLVPTRELCRQVEKQIRDLIYYCKDTVAVYSLGDDNTAVQTYRLREKPDIIVSTPAKLVQFLQSKTVDLKATTALVIDEADLVLSFGYADDVAFITQNMSKIFQGMLMSATLSPELEKLKRVVLHNPAILKLEEDTTAGHLTQFYLTLPPNDKFLVLYVFLKLGLLQGRGLIFVNNIDNCYRVKLYLQQFHIRAAVLNAELPLNSRLHILEEYNRGVFDYLVATDESIDTGDDDEHDDDEDDDAAAVEAGSDDEGVEDENEDDDEQKEEAAELGSDVEDEEDEEEDSDEENADEDEEEEEDGDDDEDEEEDEDEEGEEEENEEEQVIEEEATGSKRQKRKRGERNAVDSSEYGVSRGIDFQGVAWVVNFDFPLTSAAYTHRIGRTARGGAKGTALSFVSSTNPQEWETLEIVRSQQPALPPVEGDDVLAAISSTDADATAGVPGMSNSASLRAQPAPLSFNMKELDTFRYRTDDVLRSVTTTAVKELRAAELRQEIMNSDKLQSYFQENPDDLKILRHDRAVVHPIRQLDHLKHLPSYLIPKSMRPAINSAKTFRRKKRKNVGGMNQEKRIAQSKQRDPLQAIEAGDGGDHDDGGDDAGDTNTAKAYTSTRVQELGPSTSNRLAWQKRHRKGRFNDKANAKKRSKPGQFF